MGPRRAGWTALGLRFLLQLTMYLIETAFVLGAVVSSAALTAPKDIPYVIKTHDSAAEGVPNTEFSCLLVE